MAPLPPSLDSVLPVLLSLPEIFDETQQSTTNHRKNIVRLIKIHTQVTQVTAPSPKKNRPERRVGEQAFNQLFLGLLERCLSVKKGVVAGDRVGKFVAGFVHALADKESSEEEDEDTASSRFFTELISMLLRGFPAKDKAVRFRCTQLVSLLLKSMPELDEDLFQQLRSSLLERTRDKEGPVRVQAVLGLMAFRDIEPDGDEDEEDVMEVLLDILTMDPSSDVRQTALFSLPTTSQTLPHILLRIKDLDPTLRRSVYLVSLSPENLGDPRRLTISQREALVRTGLGDRDPKVRKAAGYMIGTWVEAIKTSSQGEVNDEEMGGLIEFLKRFDVVSSEEAEKALFSVFEGNVDTFQGLEFTENYWKTLNPEKALLARVFVDHCREISDETRLESTLPVVTALAFYLQAEYNHLLQLFEDADEHAGQKEDGQRPEEKRDWEQEILEKEFVIREMLKLAVGLDYSDEIGRRKMWGLAREMISQQSLPASLIPYNLDVLRKLSSTEKDLMRVIVEVIHEIRDTVLDSSSRAGTPALENDDEDDDDDEEGGGEARKEKELRERLRRLSLGGGDKEKEEERTLRRMLVDVRSLDILKALLERVNGTLQENSVLHGLIPMLITPSVISKQPELRERGLVCLGLVCTIDKKSAPPAFRGLFLSQAQSAQGPLLNEVLQIIFDLLMLYDIKTLLPQSNNESSLADLVLYHLDQSEDAALAIAVEGAAKLMLAGFLTDESVLSQLVQLYVWPDNADNAALRQCLSYFLPVYCFSSSANQRRMQRIFLSTLKSLNEEAEELSEDKDMLSSNQVALFFLEWTDPLKSFQQELKPEDQELQVDMSIDLLKGLFVADWVTERKHFTQILNKLYFPDGCDLYKLRQIILLIKTIQSGNYLKDSVSRNALARFETSLTRRFSLQLAELGKNEPLKMEGAKKSVNEFLSELGLDEVNDDDTGTPMPSKPISGSRRKAPLSTVSIQSRASTSSTGGNKLRQPPTTETDEEASTEDEQGEEDEEGDRESTPMPSSRPDGKKSTPVVEASEEETEEEVDEEEEEAAPPARVTGPHRSKQLVHTQSESEEDEDEDAVDDSLLVDDEEGEEEEGDSLMDDSEED